MEGEKGRGRGGVPTHTVLVLPWQSCTFFRLIEGMRRPSQGVKHVAAGHDVGMV